MSHDPSSTIRVAAVDGNGLLRGKRVPASYVKKLDKGAVRLPLSVLSVDIFGADIENSPLVFESGDVDGVLRPVARGPVPMPWLKTPSDLHLMQLFHDDGTPFAGDPITALSRVLDQYADKGWTVVAATELEFYLVSKSGDQLVPPATPATGRVIGSEDILSLRELDGFEAFFDDLYAGAAAMDIPAQAAISESGVGQFEVNLLHGPAMKAAEDALLFKELVKGLALKHGFMATFMAKPFADQAGNGMHVHFSVEDRDGANIFADGTDTGSAALEHAIAGCMRAMADSTLIFAPHANSFDRLVPNSHAPTAICWAHENRTAALRIPGGAPAAKRIEHRVAGGDINPFLLLATILGAAFDGISAQDAPPPAIEGNAYALDLPHLAESWQAAIETFEHSPYMAAIFDPDFIRGFVSTKTQELRKVPLLPENERLLMYCDRL